jgi:hypothetical protein
VACQAEFQQKSQSIAVREVYGLYTNKTVSENLVGVLFFTATRGQRFNGDLFGEVTRHERSKGCPTYQQLEQFQQFTVVGVPPNISRHDRWGWGGVCGGGGKLHRHTPSRFCE